MCVICGAHAMRPCAVHCMRFSYAGHLWGACDAPLRRALHALFICGSPVGRMRCALAPCIACAFHMRVTCGAHAMRPCAVHCMRFSYVCHLWGACDAPLRRALHAFFICVSPVGRMRCALAPCIACAFHMRVTSGAHAMRPCAVHCMRFSYVCHLWGACDAPLRRALHALFICGSPVGRMRCALAPCIACAFHMRVTSGAHAIRP